MIKEKNIDEKIEKKEKTKRKEVSKKKLETAKKLAELIRASGSIIIASIKNMPSRQFQDIRKKLKGKAEVRVVKKRVMWKALEGVEKNLGELKDYVQEDSAILFSRLDAFELAGILAENKNPIGARAGQTSEENIEIEEGPTDLVPGPAISELGALGIKIAVEEGKIAIKEKKVIVKVGEKISEAAASVMAKLDIKPFYIGLEPLAMYDAKNGKIYTNIKIDKEKTIIEMKISAAKAIGFARKIVYYCKETIGYLLAKANIDYNALSRLQTKAQTEKIENTDEKKKQENKIEENQVQQINNQEEK